MKNSDHPNIVKLYDIWEDNRYVSLVMECCSGGELFDYIIKKQHLSEREASEIFRQVITAIRYLHSN